MSLYTNKTVFVTGANRGIGLAFVKHLLDQSARVIAGARKPDEAEDLHELAQKHPALKLVQFDATDDTSIKAAASKTAETFPNGLDLLINNAGVMGVRSLDNTTRQDILDIINTNVAGPLATTQAFTELLQKSKYPSSFKSAPTWVQLPLLTVPLQDLIESAKQH